MALPTLEKTWQFAHTSNTLSGFNAADIKDVFLRVKNALKAFGTNPLTCVGSSNSASANMSGTDLLSANADIVFASGANPHSWIVLEMASGAQICFDFNQAFINYLIIHVSPTGFSGGSVTARPTAADSQELLNDSFQGMLGDGSSGGQIRSHIMLSTDGKCLRIINANNGTVGGFLLVDQAMEPVSGWTDPMVATFKGFGINTNTGETVLNIGSWYGSAILKAVGPLGVMPLFPSMECATANTPVVQQFNGANEISGEYPAQPMGLWHNATAGQRGRHGHLADLWFTNQILQNGDTMPITDTKEFVVFGDMTFPGDGTDWATG